MDEEKILTGHPQGKKGVRISKIKYELIKSKIIDCFTSKDLNNMELTNCVNQKLDGIFEGSISWYVETVKLDLEAKKIIERIIEMKTHLYRLKH